MRRPHRMDSRATVYIAPAVARHALIGLVGEIAWAQRNGTGPASLPRIRNEALALLVRIDRGDADAATRAMRLVNQVSRAA
jgi:hypothetical protein